MARLVPLGSVEGDDSYPLWLAVFAAIVIPLSLLDLAEQATVQVFLSGCRIVMVLLMVFTPLASAALGGDHFGNVGHAEPAGAVWFDLSNIYKMFPAIVFSALFHQAVPGLADEMKDKPNGAYDFEVGSLYSSG